MEIKKEQINKLHKGLGSCPEAQKAIKDAFPEAFENEWEEIPKEIMTLQWRSEARYKGELGIMILPEDYYMPYSIKFVDVWGGDREDENPMTKLFVYKLVNGQIYRKKR